MRYNVDVTYHVKAYRLEQSQRRSSTPRDRVRTAPNRPCETRYAPDAREKNERIDLDRPAQRSPARSRTFEVEQNPEPLGQQASKSIGQQVLEQAAHAECTDGTRPTQNDRGTERVTNGDSGTRKRAH